MVPPPDSLNAVFDPMLTEIWDFAHVREEDLETTEGEGVDFLAELLELAGWTQVDDEETETDFP